MRIHDEVISASSLKKLALQHKVGPQGESTLGKRKDRHTNIRHV
jgi:hypothetical protein